MPQTPATPTPIAKPTVLASLAARLAQGDEILSAWCGIADPVISGMLAQEAFDAVTLDMQHGPITLGEVIRAIPMINAAGKPALARTPVGEFQNVSKLIGPCASDPVRLSGVRVISGTAAKAIHHPNSQGRCELN